MVGPQQIYDIAGISLFVKARSRIPEFQSGISGASKPRPDVSRY